MLDNLSIDINQPSIPSVSHSQVLNLLLSQLQPIPFVKRADLGNGEGLSRKHYIIIAIDEILVIANQNKWSLCINEGSFYVYNGAFWGIISKNDLIPFLGKASEQLGVDKFDAKYHHFRSDLLKQFMCSTHLPKQGKAVDEVKINLQNGTFQITPRGLLLQKFKSEDFLTYQLSFPYSKNSIAPEFQKYLDRVLPDKTQQMILAEFIGYVFVKPSTLKLEKALILYGGGANGKSVFFEIINALLGQENVSSFGLQSLTNENGYYRAKLGTKLLNYTSEISNNMNSTLFKQLVSGEPIEARLPYSEPIILENYAKLMFNANELPKDVEHNLAFYRRFLILSFNVTIPQNERDPELAKRIISNELSGVFNWVLSGLNRILLNKGFTYSDSVDQVITQYSKQSDTVHLFLEDGSYEPDFNEEVPLKLLYNEFKTFCCESGYKSISLKAFSERLRQLGINVHRKANGNVVDLIKKGFVLSALTTLCTSNINLN